MGRILSKSVSRMKRRQSEFACFELCFLSKVYPEYPNLSQDTISIFAQNALKVQVFWFDFDFAFQNHSELHYQGEERATKTLHWRPTRRLQRLLGLVLHFAFPKRYDWSFKNACYFKFIVFFALQDIWSTGTFSDRSGIMCSRANWKSISPTQLSW